MDRVDHEKLLIQDLLNLIKNQELHLTPWYQRRSVWTTPQKSYLINTLFENKPIPSLYIRHSLDIELEKSIREMVDGQQRVRAIFEYADDKFVVKHPAHPSKVKYSQLKPKEKESFKLTSLSVGYLLGATDEDVIEIFGRLNSVAKTLNAQEKRNARFSGDFKQFCLRQAVKRLPLWRDLNIFSSNDIARMNEVQFISDLTLNLLNGLSDYSSGKLDKIYAQFDDTFPRQKSMELGCEKIFSQIAGLKPEAIRETVFSRPPLFFSLCLALNDASHKLKPTIIENALHAVDENLTSDIPISDRNRRDANFYVACTSSTQRIKHRKIRDSFIKKHLGI